MNSAFWFPPHRVLELVHNPHDPHKPGHTVADYLVAYARDVPDQPVIFISETQKLRAIANNELWQIIWEYTEDSEFDDGNMLFSADLDPLLEFIKDRRRVRALVARDFRKRC